MKNSMKLAAITVTAAAVMAWGATSIYAHGWGGADQNTLVQRLVQKFGLKTADVQSVFDTVHEERQAQMEQKIADRLDTFVKDGKITEAQKKLILAKHEELQKNREADLQAWQNLTPEERRTKMDAQHTDLENWAKQNNIDVQYVLGFGREMGRGMGRGMGMNGVAK